MGYNIFQTFLIDSEQRLAIEIVRNLISRPSAQEFGLDLGTRHHGIAGRVHFMLQRRVLGMRERDFVGLLRTREFRFHLSTREARIHRRRAKTGLATKPAIRKTAINFLLMLYSIRCI